MGLHRTSDADEIAELLRAALIADPLANTVYGSILIGLHRSDAAPWAAHPVGEPLVLAARSQAHTPIALTQNWTDVRELGTAIAALDPPAASVAAAPAVIDELVTSVGRPVTVRMDERLFRLDELLPPTGVAGTARAAREDDADLLVAWFLDFGEEAFGHRASDEYAREQLTYAMARGTPWLWTVEGDVVSFAHRHAAEYGAARIGPVYTPPEHRGHGYGSAATAAAARHILDEHAVPCLYTDLANPTSNKIYQAIGFRPVLDRCSVNFG